MIFSIVNLFIAVSHVHGKFFTSHWIRSSNEKWQALHSKFNELHSFIDFFFLKDKNKNFILKFTIFFNEIHYFNKKIYIYSSPKIIYSFFILIKALQALVHCFLFLPKFDLLFLVNCWLFGLLHLTVWVFVFGMVSRLFNQLLSVPVNFSTLNGSMYAGGRQLYHSPFVWVEFVPRVKTLSKASRLADK